MIRKLPGKHGRIPGKGQPWGQREQEVSSH